MLIQHAVQAPRELEALGAVLHCEWLVRDGRLGVRHGGLRLFIRVAIAAAGDALDLRQPPRALRERRIEVVHVVGGRRGGQLLLRCSFQCICTLAFVGCSEATARCACSTSLLGKSC